MVPCRLSYILLIWKLLLTRRKRNRTSRCASRAADFSSSWMNKSPCISRRSINHHCQQRPADQIWKQVETRTIASYHFFYQITKVNITFMHQSHNTHREREIIKIFDDRPLACISQQSHQKTEAIFLFYSFHETIYRRKIIWTFFYYLDIWNLFK